MSAIDWPEDDQQCKAKDLIANGESFKEELWHFLEVYRIDNHNIKATMNLLLDQISGYCLPIPDIHTGSEPVEKKEI